MVADGGCFRAEKLLECGINVLRVSHLNVDVLGCALNGYLGVV